MHTIKNHIKKHVQSSKFPFTSQRGLLFSEQEATLSDKSPLLLAFSTTHFSFELLLPFKGPISCSEYISPEAHHAIFPGHPWSVPDVHQRAPDSFAMTTNFCIKSPLRFNFWFSTAHFLHHFAEACKLSFWFNADQFHPQRAAKVSRHV